MVYSHFITVKIAKASKPMNFDSINEQLIDRQNDRPIISYDNNESPYTNGGDLPLFITSPTDLGVCRNGGRRGAAFGASAILNCFSKLNIHHDRMKHVLSSQVSFINQELEDFENAQKISARTIEKELKRSNQIIHLGGGHDHIYPLLCAIDEKTNKDKIIVINIDAHLDTRTDELAHSGTPFRQFSKYTKKNFELYQLGIHPFANSISTNQNLENGFMLNITADRLRELTNGFTHSYNPFKSLNIDTNNSEVIISLDADGLDSSFMSGVSAVNHNGLPLHFVRDLIEHYKFLNLEKKYFGVYEYNPIYDDLSQKGARAITYLIDSFLNTLH